MVDVKVEIMVNDGVAREVSSGISKRKSGKLGKRSTFAGRSGMPPLLCKTCCFSARPST